MAATIISTAKPMLGGADATAAVGGQWTITVAGNWAEDTQALVVLTNAVTGESITIGMGAVTGKEPIFALTYNKKLNLLFSTTWAFSAINQPTIFNDLNSLGSGSVELADAYSETDDAQAIVPYQGKVAIFGKNHIQVWQIDADPAQYQLTQVLERIGTVARLSVQPLGELDVFFLSRTGIRSLRVKDSSLNATLVDVGSPIDGLVQTSLLNATAAEIAASCGIIEPTTGQYWCFIEDKVYVLSYFPSAKISAWSTWLCTYEGALGVQAPFIPDKFVQYNGQVIASSSDAFYVYGGASRGVYDTSVCQWETAWMDADTPANEKALQHIDVAQSGTWAYSAGTDYISATLTTLISSTTAATFAGGRIDFSSRGTHFKFKGVSAGNSTRCTVSNLLLHYKLTNQK